MLARVKQSESKQDRRQAGGHDQPPPVPPPLNIGHGEAELYYPFLGRGNFSTKVKRPDNLPGAVLIIPCGSSPVCRSHSSPRVSPSCNQKHPCYVYYLLLSASTGFPPTV